MTSLGPQKSRVVQDATHAAVQIFALSPDLLGSAERNGYFTALNPAWEKTLGFSCEALMEQPFIEFVHPADREATIAEFERLRAGVSVSAAFENRYAVRDGAGFRGWWRSPPTGTTSSPAT